ncbi:hypothetical protein QVO10_16655, partial [Bacteroides gallinaceum]
QEKLFGEIQNSFLSCAGWDEGEIAGHLAKNRSKKELKNRPNHTKHQVKNIFCEIRFLRL